MFLSVPSVLLHGKVPPPVAEETHHGSVHQPSQLHRDAGRPRGSAKVTVLAGDSCHLLRQPLQLGKGSLAGTVPGVGHPSAESCCQAHPSHALDSTASYVPVTAVWGQPMLERRGGLVFLWAQWGSLPVPGGSC